MSGAGPSLHTPDFPSWSVFKFPPDSAPPPITNPYAGEPTFANPFHIPQGIYEGALAYKVPLYISTVYAVVVTYFNWYNRQHGNKPWRIAKTRAFFAFVIFHNVFLAVYSAVTCVAMVRALKRSFPHYSDPNAVVGTVDALCKINGPRGLGDAVTYNTTTNTWASKNANVLIDAATGLPDSTDVGRIWNEGLAFWGWWFYLSKFYEVLDTAIILAKGKRSTTLQKYHHAGAMLSMWAGMRFMSPPIWMFVLVNSGIHAMMYTYYTVAALGYRVPNAVKRTLTTMQITQFLVGTTYAACHLFVSYTVPVSIAYQVAEKVAPKLNVTSASSVVSSATSAAAAALPTATGAAVAFLRKLIYRAAGDEGLAENIAVPGQPLPYHQQQQALAAGQKLEHPIEQFFHHPHETVNKIIYRNEYQSVPCIDTSGQAFAIYLNLIYLTPLTFLFMRFFFKSYLRRTSPNAKHQTKHTAITKAARDASHGVARELDSVDKSAEKAVSSAVNMSKDAVRGRKTNANGIAKDERHGSLSPANKKFVDSFKRKVNEELSKIDETATSSAEKAKKAMNDLAKSKDNVKEEVANTAENIKQEADEKIEQQSQKANGNAQKPNGTADEQSQGWETAGKSQKKSKLPQKKKNKETEESGVLVKKEDAEEDVKKPEKEPEPKDVNNTLGKDEGKGLF